MGPGEGGGLGTAAATFQNVRDDKGSADRSADVTHRTDRLYSHRR